MVRAHLATIGGRRVIALDTISHVAAEHAGAIIVTGSHGGVSSGEFAARHPVAAVFFNDAGIGKDDAGVAGLATLEATGTAAGTVSHDSAVIGDAQDAWETGVVSVLNAPARAAGFRTGERLQDAIRRVYGDTA